MKTLLAATPILATAMFAALPASAQDRRDSPSPAAPSPAARQVLASGDQPDVLLDVPNLSVEEITLEVDKVDVNISLDARLANLLKLTAGAEAHIDKVKLSVKGVKAQATLIVRLDNVRGIIERTLQTLDNNPQIVQGLLSTVDNTVGTVGGVAGRTVDTVGGVARDALSSLRVGQVLNLASSGLSEVSRTTNAAGQTVRQVRSGTGQLLEVVTDAANKIVSSRSLPAR